jgi:formate hydrogenlyase subunit 4
MGSAREVTFAVLSEPALFFAFLVLAKMTASLSLTPMLHGAAGIVLSGAAPSIVLISIGLFIVLLAESCRIPVDDPNTHLELTMIHEAMVLDHGGPLMGIITYASSLKLFILGSILLNVAAPIETGLWWANWLVFVGGIMIVAVAIGVLESIIARLRMRRVPYLLVTALLLCASSFILLLR